MKEIGSLFHQWLRSFLGKKEGLPEMAAPTSKREKQCYQLNTAFSSNRDL
jgi:hypothetical protein